MNEKDGHANLRRRRNPFEPRWGLRLNWLNSFDPKEMGHGGCRPIAARVRSLARFGVLFLAAVTSRCADARRRSATAQGQGGRRRDGLRPTLADQEFAFGRRETQDVTHGVSGYVHSVEHVCQFADQPHAHVDRDSNLHTEVSQIIYARI
jgi:hypothetical protein